MVGLVSGNWVRTNSGIDPFLGFERLRIFGFGSCTFICVAVSGAGCFLPGQILSIGLVFPNLKVTVNPTLGMKRERM